MNCNTPGMLSLFYYIKIAMNIIFIAAPVLVLVLGTIDFLGTITANDEKKMKKSVDNFVKRLIICVVILILPLLINIIMSVVNVKSYKECFANATKANIEKLDKEYEAKRKLEEEKLRKKLEEQQSQSGSQSGSQGGTTITIPTGGTKTVENALGIPYYNQCDSRWSKIVYDSGGATLCSSSCGYTSLAMIAAGLSHNSSINPYSIIKDIRGIKDGERTHRGYGAASTSELTNSKYISRYNIKAESINKSNIVNALKQGKPVIALVPGHYITLSISTNGNIVLLDPFTNWANRSRRVGEYTSIAQIEAAYGGISWAAAYQRI